MANKDQFLEIEIHCYTTSHQVNKTSQKVVDSVIDVITPECVYIHHICQNRKQIIKDKHQYQHLRLAFSMHYKLHRVFYLNKLLNSVIERIDTQLNQLHGVVSSIFVELEVSYSERIPKRCLQECYAILTPPDTKKKKKC